jgi:nucleoside-diphosphate-sugar epimerase
MGYVGPQVVRHLRERFPDARLSGLDTGYFAHCLTGVTTLPERRLDVQHFMDLRHVSSDILEGVDAVVNLAAISNDPMGNVFEKATMEINFEAGVSLAKMAKQAGVSSFVFASSCSVYGFAEGLPRKEQDAVQPLTAYARSKVETERALMALADDAFVVTCLRFPTACGMSDRLRLDLVLNDFVASAIASGKIEILSDGTPWRPLIDTNDMALAMEWALQRDPRQSANGLAINVGRQECNYQVRDLAEAVAREISGLRISINPDAAPDKRSYQVDFGLYAKLAPNHLPRYKLSDSIVSLADGLKRMQFANADFRQSHYMRLRVLDDLKSRQLLNEQLEWVRDAG